MSAADRVVAFAAGQLPHDQRARYAEEWQAQLDGAAEAGVSRAAVAIGALGFALRAPYPSLSAAERWGRWALAIALAAPALWFAMNQASIFFSYPPVRETAEVLVSVSILAVLVLAGVAMLRARRITGMVLATAVVLCLTGALWVVGTPRPVFFGAALALATIALAVIAIFTLRGRLGSPRQAMPLLLASVVPVVIGVTWLGTQSLPVEAVPSVVRWTPGAVAVVVLAIALIAVQRAPRVTGGRLDGWLRFAAVTVTAATVAAMAIAALVGWMTLTGDLGPAQAKSWERFRPEVLATLVVVAIATITILAIALIVLATARSRGDAARRWAASAALIAAAAICMVAVRLVWVGPPIHDARVPLDVTFHIVGALACALFVVAVVRLIIDSGRAVGLEGSIPTARPES